MDKTARSFNEACTTTLGQNFKGYYADNAINKDDILHSVYGILHSPEYQHRFAADLKKMLPHIPFAGDFRAFSQAGRDLANWHLHYETVEPYPLHESMPLLETDDTYPVPKIAFAKQGKDVDKSVIRYNSHITLSGIPPETYAYIANGKPALEWIMERYQTTTDKDSGITNNANDWSDSPISSICLNASCG